MLDYFMTWIYADPDDAKAAGRGLIAVGAWLLCCGVLGQVLIGFQTTAISGLGLLVPATLSTVYPDVPTWWVPESLIGALPALLLMAVGTLVVREAKEANRMINLI